jgi:hypothetical protein
MWITVENQRVFGDIFLGISKSSLQGSRFFAFFPQRSPQLFTSKKNPISYSYRKVICNYKFVISFTHLSTAVITTNFKYKFLSHKVPLLSQEVFQGAAR